MSFRDNLSKVNNFMFLFGISLYKFNDRSNRFECSTINLSYSVLYFLFISIALLFVSYGDHSNTGTTYSFLSILNFITVITIFSSILINLLVNRQKHANFLNKMLETDASLAELNIDLGGDNLLRMHWQHIAIVFSSAAFYVFYSIKERNRMNLSEHVWSVLHFFRITSLMLVAYYIRCIAVILTHRCRCILSHIDLNIKNDINQGKSVTELIKCFKAFDELTNLKKEMSQIYGVLLLLSSAFDFIKVTINIYGLLYDSKELKIELFVFFACVHVPNIVKCIILAEALDTLAKQIDGLRKCTLNLSAGNNDELSDFLDLMHLKIRHMEKEKYVTANDYYPVNRSMLYGMGSAIVTQVVIIFQFQQWEDNQDN